MSGPTNQQNATLDYLFNASFSLVGSVPSLSSFYMKQLQTSLRMYEVKNHPTLQKTCCSKCGTIKLPGINHKVEIRKRVANTVHNNKKSDKKINKQRKNQLVENCLACGHVKTYYGSQKKKLPKDTMTKQVKPAEQQQQQQQQQQTKNKQPNKQQQSQLIPEKKKKNKSKKNNLQALLSKQKEQKPSPSTSGSLNDFLSSL